MVSPDIPFRDKEHTCQNKTFLLIFINIVAVQLFLNRNNKKLFSNKKIQYNSSHWNLKLKANSITDNKTLSVHYLNQTPTKTEGKTVMKLDTFASSTLDTLPKTTRAVTRGIKA